MYQRVMIVLPEEHAEEAKVFLQPLMNEPTLEEPCYDKHGHTTLYYGKCDLAKEVINFALMVMFGGSDADFSITIVNN